jgi:hypothetical protein
MIESVPVTASIPSLSHTRDFAEMRRGSCASSPATSRFSSLQRHLASATSRFSDISLQLGDGRFQVAAFTKSCRIRDGIRLDENQRARFSTRRARRGGRRPTCPFQSWPSFISSAACPTASALPSQAATPPSHRRMGILQAKGRETDRIGVFHRSFPGETDRISAAQQRSSPTEVWRRGGGGGFHPQED